jgi:hypothetical protein
MKSNLLWLGAVLAVFAGAAPDVHAQVITNGEIDRNLSSPRSPVFDNTPYTARYSYGMATAPLYINGNARQLWYLDYLDRADRAEKFGYRMPIDPYFEAPPPAGIAPAGRAFMGFGIFRPR